MAAKKREIYARAAVQLRSHERPTMAEKRCPGAMGLYLFLLLQARGEETWGDVAELIAHTSWGAPAAYRRKQAEALIFAGLVDRREDGRLHVVKYEEHNDTPDTIEANRKGSRERKQVSRDKHRDTSLGHIDVTRDSGCDIAGTDASVPISSSPSSFNSESREGECERETASARYQAAYAAGISRGKRAPWVWPGSKYAEWDLGKIIKGFAKDDQGQAYRGNQLLRYLEFTAESFAADVSERGKSQFYSAYEPRGCLKWLNEAELAREARRVG